LREVTWEGVVGFGSGRMGAAIVHASLIRYERIMHIIKTHNTLKKRDKTTLEKIFDLEW
jgi:hypothetical protein